MMADIFSSFDPVVGGGFSYLPSPIFWGLSGLNILLIGGSFWVMPGRGTWAVYNVVGVMASQVGRTMGVSLKGFSSVVVPLFLFLILSNLFGLIPYVFSFSSHLIFTLSFGFPIWTSLIISSLFSYPYSFFASLLPSGAPDWLNPFLALLEVLSILARPITLSFRLAANMSAGHIILGLISVYSVGAFFSSFISAGFLFFILTFYVIFELGICFVQAYIFCLLASLYSDNHPNH